MRQLPADCAGQTRVLFASPWRRAGNGAATSSICEAAQRLGRRDRIRDRSRTSLRFARPARSCGKPVTADIEVMPTISDLAAASVPLSRPEIRRIVYGLMMAMLLGALDQTIVATALPTIGRDLHDVVHLPWVVTAYLLTATGSVPIYGKLADTYGRRPALLGAIAIFIAGSIGCAMAPTLGVLVGARLVQGIGGGGLLALSQTIVGDMMSPRERASWQVYFAAAFTTASLAGPVLGGFFAQHLSWSMIFWINVPLGLAAYAMTSSPLRRLPRHERRGKLDIPGAVLLVGGTTTLLLTLSGVGTRYGWLAAPTFASAALSVALFAAFAWHLRRTPSPLIPLDVLSNPVVLAATVAATLSIGLFLGLAVYVPILFETVRGLDPSRSGLAMLPLTVGTVAGALMAGRVMARYAHYKWLTIAALPFAAAAALLLMPLAGTLPIWALSLVLAVISTSLGTILPISTVSIQNAVALHQLGTATATANLCRQLGGAVAVAVFGAVILGGGTAHEVVTRGAAHAAAHHAIDMAPLLHAFRLVFAIVAAGAGLALAVMMAMEERPLTGPIRAEGLPAGE